MTARLVLQRLLSDRTAPLPETYQAEHEALRAEISALLSTSDTDEDMRTTRLDVVLVAYGDLLLRAHYSAPIKQTPIDEAPESQFDLAALCASLESAYGDDWTVLSYIFSGDTLLLNVLTPDGALIEQTPYDEQLRRLVTQATLPAYRHYTYRDIPYLQGIAAQPWAGLCALANRLLPAVARARLHPQHRLLIVPAGPLHALPWGALRLAEGWLVEHAIVQLAPSLAAWQALAARLPPSSCSALLVGCGKYGVRASTLPATEAELAAVAARWTGPCDRLLDTQATRTALLDRSARGDLAQYSLLHFAGHARLLPARGLAAHLKLWDADLLLPEVAGLRLDGALVVLSACDGAATDILPGEEVLSLSWAFLAAGASSVLASLWRVEDTMAVQVMSAFYDALLHHHDAAVALAQMQRELIAVHANDSDLAVAPSIWASFVLTGIGHLPM
jgi:CHAT domain-containing protein